MRWMLTLVVFLVVAEAGDAWFLSRRRSSRFNYNPAPPSSSRCVATLCSSYSSNSPRGSDGYGQGHFGAPRGSRTHNGVDVRCSSGDAVRAPFDGILVRQARPYSSGKTCCNNGFLFRGTGEWAGYEVKMFYNRPTGGFGRSYRKGDQVATHLSLRCSDCYDSRMTDHTHFQMTRNGVIIDPTSFVYNC